MAKKPTTLSPEYYSMLKARNLDKFTPITPEILQIFETLKREWGTWRAVSARLEIKLRYLRKLRQVEPYVKITKYPTEEQLAKGEGHFKVTVRNPRKCISIQLMDRILTKSNLPLRIDDFPWYSPEELMEMGIWSVNESEWYAKREHVIPVADVEHSQFEV